MLLDEWREMHPASKKLSVGVLVIVIWMGPSTYWERHRYNMEKMIQMLWTGFKATDCQHCYIPGVQSRGRQSKT